MPNRTPKEVMVPLLAAGNRMQLLAHEIADRWAEENTSLPATRQEVLDGVAALGEMSASVTAAIVWMIETITEQLDKAASQEDGRDRDA